VVFLIETGEERNSGYLFLSILPVKKIEIVSAKFLLVLGATAVIAAANCLLFTLWTASAQQAAQSRRVILVAALACLLFTGFAYAGIFALGMARFVTVILVLALAGNVALTFIFRSLRGKMVAGFAAWLKPLLDDQHLALTALVCLAAYAGLVLLATAALRYEPRSSHFPWT
jgi:hypothetical protein